MRIEESQDGGVLVLRLVGDMDVVDLPSADGRVAARLAEGARHVVFDLSAVSLLPSTAVGVLIAVNRRVRARGGRLALAGVPRLVRGTLATMGVDQLFRMYADVQSAVAALDAQPPAG